MKKQLLKKFSYFIVPTLSGAMMFSASTNAQIIYTDVIPDSTLHCQVPNGIVIKSYSLDLNNDANNDFILSAYYNNPPQIGNETLSRVNASPLNGNAVKDTLVNSDTVSIPLQFNAVIDSNLLLNQSWQTLGSQILKNGAYGGSLVSDTVWGLWDNLSDYYLGLRLLQAGQTHYGWVRLHVDVTSQHASLIVRDYAYNSIPNQPILAGQTVATGISPLSFGEELGVRLFPNPVKDKLTITLDNNNQVEVTIADITGKIIYSSTASETQKIEINTQDFAAGIYVVQIQSADFIATKKLIVEN